MTVLQLFCWVLGGGVQDVFPVEIPTTETVDALKRAIKKNAFGDVDADTLVLWKAVSISRERGFKERISAIKLDEEESLLPWEKLSEVFPDPPAEKQLHIIVQPPPTAAKPGAKRHADSDPVLNKRRKISTISPSACAEASQYMSSQAKPSERIFDDRPEQDKEVPPMALLYDGFGHFLDVFHGRTMSPVLASAPFEAAVNQFASQMIQFYGSDDFRRDEGLKGLNKIFSAAMGLTTPQLVAGSVATVRCDGHVVGDRYLACCVVQFKNEATEVLALPDVELTSYVAHIRRAALDSPENKTLEDKRIPCLGITIVGPYVTFYGIIFFGWYRLIALTPALSCVPSSGDGYDQRALHLAFAAAAELRTRLQNLQREHIPFLLPASHCLPYVSRLRTYGQTLSEEYLDFEIRELYKQEYRLLYIAVTAKGKEILVKFTTCYSIELHAFCAEKGHAPAILAFETLPGGWYALAMECITSAVPLSMAQTVADNGARWEKELTDLVREFHIAGFVHGDLRDPNILCDSDNLRVLLVDFDWGGKAGKVSYHTALLNPDLTDGRTRGDLLITAEDDIRILNKTLDGVRGKYASRLQTA